MDQVTTGGLLLALLVLGVLGSIIRSKRDLFVAAIVVTVAVVLAVSPSPAYGAEGDDNFDRCDNGDCNEFRIQHGECGCGVDSCMCAGFEEGRRGD